MRHGRLGVGADQSFGSRLQVSEAPLADVTPALSFANADRPDATGPSGAVVDPAAGTDAAAQSAAAAPPPETVATGTPSDQPPQARATTEVAPPETLAAGTPDDQPPPAQAATEAAPPETVATGMSDDQLPSTQTATEAAAPEIAATGAPDDQAAADSDCNDRSTAGNRCTCRSCTGRLRLNGRTPPAKSPPASGLPRCDASAERVRRLWPNRTARITPSRSRASNLRRKPSAVPSSGRQRPSAARTDGRCGQGLLRSLSSAPHLKRYYPACFRFQSSTCRQSPRLRRDRRHCAIRSIWPGLQTNSATRVTGSPSITIWRTSPAPRPRS